MKRGIPVVISQNGLGAPIRPVESNAPLMTVSENGMGVPIVVTDNGAPFIVDGLAWTPAELFENGATGLWLAGGDPAQRYGPDQVPGAYLDAAGADPLTEAGQSAGKVLDLSEGAVVSGGTILGNHATQSTQAAEPTLRYDSGVSRFYWEPDGADFWEADGAAGTLLGDFEIHAAVRWTGNSVLVSKMDTSYDATSSPLGWMLYSASDRKPVFLYRPPSGGTIVTAGSNIIDDGADVVISTWRVAGVITVAVDGAAVGQIGPTPSSVEEYGNFAANLQMFRTWRGSNDWGSYWNSRLYGDGLVIINNKSLTTDERSSLIKYLAALQGRSL